MVEERQIEVRALLVKLRSDLKELLDDSLSCTIDLVEFSESNAMTPPCGHSIGKDVLDRYRRDGDGSEEVLSCSLCRRELRVKDFYPTPKLNETAEKILNLKAQVEKLTASYDNNLEQGRKAFAEQLEKINGEKEAVQASLTKHKADIEELKGQFTQEKADLTQEITRLTNELNIANQKTKNAQNQYSVSERKKGELEKQIKGQQAEIDRLNKLSAQAVEKPEAELPKASVTEEENIQLKAEIEALKRQLMQQTAGNDGAASVPLKNQADFPQAENKAEEKAPTIRIQLNANAFTTLVLDETFENRYKLEVVRYVVSYIEQELAVGSIKEKIEKLNAPIQATIDQIAELLPAEKAADYQKLVVASYRKAGYEHENKNAKIALWLYWLATQHKNVKDRAAQFYMGKLYSEGKGIKKNQAQAVKLYEKSAEQGFAEAQYELARCYTSNDLGVKENRFEAMRLLRLAADQGMVEAQARLKKSLSFVIEHPLKAILMTKVAAEQGHADAQKLMNDALNRSRLNQVFDKYRWLVEAKLELPVSQEGDKALNIDDKINQLIEAVDTMPDAWIGQLSGVLESEGGLGGVWRLIGSATAAKQAKFADSSKEQRSPIHIDLKSFLSSPFSSPALFSAASSAKAKPAQQNEGEKNDQAAASLD